MRARLSSASIAPALVAIASALLTVTIAPPAHAASFTVTLAAASRNSASSFQSLFDASDKVIAGHGRLLASRQLGWREVPTIPLHHLSEAQAAAFMIADKRLTEIS